MSDHLINKEYHDDIPTRLEAMRQAGMPPQIWQAVYIMEGKGNQDYAEFGNIRDAEVTPQFGRHPDITHSIAHLAGRLAHTPQAEMWVSFLELGLKYGPEYKNTANTAIAENSKLAILAARNQFASEQGMRRIKPAAQRDAVIYFAAGLYLQQKINYYLKQRAKGPLRTPEEWQQQITDINRNDYPSKPKSLEDLGTKPLCDLEAAPYELITLSREEWRAITAVATNLCKPQATPLPQTYADRSTRAGAGRPVLQS